MSFEYAKKYGKGTKCPKCGKEMEIDDLDYRFDGCQDEYWKCENCGEFSALVKVRYKKVCKVEFCEHD